jgi:hypothetical protein
VRSLRSALVVSSLACGLVPSSFGGAGALSASMTPLSDGVTYSIASPPLDTYVGYTIALANAGGNTINNISFTVKARATDPAESVVLFNPAQYLPANCSANPSDASEFNCSVGQLNAGASIAAFTVFYKAPLQNLNGHFDTPGSDLVDLHLRVVYAERLGGVPRSRPHNSVAEFDTASGSPRGSVVLGTANPDLIKSGVPKTGASLYTGTAGVPTADNRSTMLAGIPGTGAISTAQLRITRELEGEQGECLNQGHFRECPTYDVTVPGTFPASSPLSTTYRIDVSSLKLPASQILNSVLITYTGDGLVNVPVGACTNGAPGFHGIPCVLSKQCYPSNAQPAGLAGDCEWILINTKNGLTKFF